MQLDGPMHSMQFSVSPRRRWMTPSRARRLARRPGGTPVAVLSSKATCVIAADSSNLPSYINSMAIVAWI